MNRPVAVHTQKAPETGDVKIITDMLSKEIEAQTKKWFDKVTEARKHKDESVENGRA
jgi:hypothetical protein